MREYHCICTTDFAGEGGKERRERGREGGRKGGSLKGVSIHTNKEFGDLVEDS